VYRRIAAATIGLSSIVRGVAYVGPASPDATPAQLAFADEVIPLSWYAFGWIGTGIICLAAALHLRPRLLAAAFGLGAAFNALWGLSFLAAWWFEDVPRAYVSATSYLTITMLILCIAARADLRKILPPPDPAGGDQCRPQSP
jgi:hypothetical protein